MLSIEDVFTALLALAMFAAAVATLIICVVAELGQDQYEGQR